jgi:drug/metabolite transporter (DMT)-like permease
VGEWIVANAGTETGRMMATALALLAAVAHASLGALQKGRFDPWLSRGAIDLCASALALPFLFVVPLPSPFLALLLAGAMLIHLGYKWVLAMAYSRGAFTAVYPVVRATGPLATVGFAWIVFGERFTAGQWGGVLLLSGGIFALAALNLREERIDAARLRAALGLAVVTGLIVALYTTWDAYAIRQAPDPFTFLVWFFFLEAFLFPPLLWPRFQAEPDIAGLFRRGLLGACIAWVSFGSIFLATRLDKVGEAAALRETSVVFAALIGWLFLRETVGARRWLLMGLIAAGAILVEFGG